MNNVLSSEKLVRRTLSIVIPFFNEGNNIRKIIAEVEKLKEQLQDRYDFEVLLVDNHSDARSVEVAREVCQRNPYCKHVRLSRNFGYQASILTGYMLCRGDAVVELDCDGEDDPLTILEFVKKWEEGFEVVYGVRLSRHEKWYVTFQRRIFYRLIDALSQIQLPVDAGDFRLIDRKVIEHLRVFKEQTLYLRGLVSFIGFNQIGVPYRRRPRYDGKSKFGWMGSLDFAWQAIAAFSSRPMAIVGYVGIGVSILSALSIVVYLMVVLTQLLSFSLLVMGILTLTFFQGATLFCLGIVGSYLGRVFEEVKQRPRSIVQEVYPSTEPTKTMFI